MYLHSRAWVFAILIERRVLRIYFRPVILTFLIKVPTYGPCLWCPHVPDVCTLWTHVAQTGHAFAPCTQCMYPSTHVIPTGQALVVPVYPICVMVATIVIMIITIILVIACFRRDYRCGPCPWGREHRRKAASYGPWLCCTNCHDDHHHRSRYCRYHQSTS